MGAGFSDRGKVEDIIYAPAKPGLGDLPESCVALILSHLDPWEIYRLAVLNRTFRQASLADSVWEAKLPENYKILVKKLFTDQETSVTTVAKKEIYDRLCCPTRLGGDTMVGNSLPHLV